VKQEAGAIRPFSWAIIFGVAGAGDCAQSDQQQSVVRFSEIECDANKRMTPGEFAACDALHAVFRHRIFPMTERMHR